MNRFPVDFPPPMLGYNPTSLTFSLEYFPAPNMIISSSAAAAATSPTPITIAVFLGPCGAGPLPPALRLFDRRQAYGLRKFKRIGGQGGRRGRGVCKAELVHDAPFAAAIGACVLTSLVAPIRSTGGEDEDGGGGIDSTDARIAVMAIIGFIPYFNWLSWVFAWLDTSKPRYLVYSIVYLAPYLRTNLSLSPEESWLPIASILICILHIQLEASIRNGDLDEAFKLLPPFSGKKDPPFKSREKSSEGGSKKHVGPSPSTDKPRDRF